MQCPDDSNVQLISKRINESNSEDFLGKRLDKTMENGSDCFNRGYSSPIDLHDKLGDSGSCLYKVEVTQGAEKGHEVVIKGKWIR